MRSRGFSLLEVLVVVAVVLLAAALLLRSSGGVAAREQAFVGQAAALLGRAGQEAATGYLPSSVVLSGGALELRVGGQALQRLPLPSSLSVASPSGGILVEYAPGGKLLLGGEVGLRGKSGEWRLLVGEAGTVKAEVVR